MSEPSKIAPALTPEEWATRSVDIYIGLVSASLESDPIWTTGDLEAVGEKPPHVVIDAARLNTHAFAIGDRHKLAALCLHDQPFGFTQEDVALLRKEWHEDGCGALYALYDHNCECAKHADVAGLRALADRIEALLPPQEARPE